MLSCPKGCSRHAARYDDGSLEFLGSDMFGLDETKWAAQVRVPRGMRAEFDDMIDRTPLRRHPPELEFYDDLHGAGGMFVGDQRVIMVGVRDMHEIAAKVVRTWPGELVRLYASGSRGVRPSAAQLFSYAFETAIRRCMAHEIGHALIFTGHANSFEPDDEAGADFYAGKLDAACSRSRTLGEMFFFSIGCVGSSCDHPSPPDRAAAYRAGYDEQKRAA